MRQKIYSLFLTALFGLWGMQAWALEPDEGGVYQIGTADDLVEFAALVNGGEVTANAVLTADIDLTGVEWTPIGNGSNIYTGTFDGQGHAITNFEYTATSDYNGLFGYISNATVKSFSISGSLTSDGFTKNGVIGCAAGSSKVTGIHSSLAISVANCKAHTGGIVGGDNGATSDLIVVDGCSFSGTITHSGAGDCQAGIMGYTGYSGIRNCIFTGTITGENSKYGGILGYCKQPSFGGVQNCLSVGKIEAFEECTTAAAIIANWNGNATANVKNNYYCLLEGSTTSLAIGNKTSNCEAPVEVTAEQLASGEVAYLLNGSKSTEVTYYQTIPGDILPVLDATHGVVYMNGRLHCNGDVYEGATYSNENAGTIQDEHDFVDGICSYCGLFDENFMTPNADGFYEIANAKQLSWFSQKVNSGDFELNALLTADIDFADLMPEGADPEETEVTWTAIGDWGGISGTSSACYKGHFDGQGHTIKNFNVTSTHNYFGIFGVVSEGSVIENFDIYGTMNLGHKTGGVVAYTRDTSCTIRNIHSYMTLNITEATTTAERPGGIVGSAVNGTTYIENCTYSGTLNVGGHTGNIGGIVGYINNNAAAIVFITNCLFDGEIQNGDTADGQCGGIVGYNNSGKATIKNCLSIGTIVSSNGNIGQLIGRLNGGNTTFANNYYVGDFVNGTSSGKTAGGSAPIEVGSSELASGEIAWKLNGETFLDAVWRQDLSEDQYPRPTNKGAVVYETPSGYDCVIEGDPDSFTSFINSVIATETDFIEDEDLMAYQALIEDFKEAIKSWEEIDNYDDFIAAYKASFELKESIKTSAANYAAYVKECNDAATYIEENSLEGTWTDFLKTYLEDTVEPGNDYPNGSKGYILENCELDDEALAEEIAFVKKMLENAIAGGVTPGTEVTRLLANSTFADGVEGWETESEGAVIATGGVKEVMPLVRGLGNGTFSISQTLSDMPNGIYMMTANALFRSGADITTQFYAGQIYLNGTANYVMSIGEDVISIEAAEPGVNCLGEGGDAVFSTEDIEGWVPKSMNGCSYAYSAGRYQNFCAGEVTDGNLTIGVRSLGTGMDSDWLPIGNVHVYYLGTPEEADEKLSDVLAAYKERAQVIMDFSFSDDPSDFMQYPNFSEELKNNLSDAIEAVDGATTGEEKMALVNTFSALFDEIYACRKAYIAMYESANKLFDFLDTLLDIGLITEDEYDDWSDLVYEAQGHFGAGDLSTEEALALAKRLNILDEMLPSVDGVYQLATAEQLKLFSMIVNNGMNDVKAVLAADIDMSEVEDFEPIGNTSYPFKGEFDGQGHKITNFGQYIVEDEETGTGYYTLQFSTAKDSNGGGGEGFFGIISGATVKNFSIDGAFEVTGGNYKGTIGQAWKSTISNVHSAMNIAISASSCHHCGGLIGSSEGGSGSTITNCSFSGTLTIAEGSTDNFGGILGYSGGDAVKNCANYGTINYTSSGCAAGGVVGYINNTTTSIQNCLNVGSVHCTTSDSPKYGGAIVGRIKNNWGSDVIVNNYWLEGSAYAPAKKDDGTSPLAASATGESAGQLASGEVCYKLNGDQTVINWFQTIGEDEYPVLFDSHKVVLFSEADGYYNEGGTSGDLNGDGKVDIADAVTVLNEMALDTPNTKCDVNVDGKVDIADFVTILNMMAAQ